MRAIFRPLFVLIALITPLAAQALECDIAVFAPLADSSPYRVSLSSAEIVDEAGGYCRLEGEIGNTDGQSQETVVPPARSRARIVCRSRWNWATRPGRRIPAMSGMARRTG